MTNKTFLESQLSYQLIAKSGNWFDQLYNTRPFDPIRPHIYKAPDLHIHDHQNSPFKLPVCDQWLTPSSTESDQDSDQTYFNPLLECFEDITKHPFLRYDQSILKKPFHDSFSLKPLWTPTYQRISEELHTWHEQGSHIAHLVDSFPSLFHQRIQQFETALHQCNKKKTIFHFRSLTHATTRVLRQLSFIGHTFLLQVDSIRFSTDFEKLSRYYFSTLSTFANIAHELALIERMTHLFVFCHNQHTTSTTTPFVNESVFKRSNPFLFLTMITNWHDSLPDLFHQFKSPIELAQLQSFQAHILDTEKELDQLKTSTKQTLDTITITAWQVIGHLQSSEAISNVLAKQLYQWLFYHPILSSTDCILHVVIDAFNNIRNCLNEPSSPAHPHLIQQWSQWAEIGLSWYLSQLMIHLLSHQMDSAAYMLRSLVTRYYSQYPIFVTAWFEHLTFQLDAPVFNELMMTLLRLTPDHAHIFRQLFAHTINPVILEEPTDSSEPQGINTPLMIKTSKVHAQKLFLQLPLSCWESLYQSITYIQLKECPLAPQLIRFYHQRHIETSIIDQLIHQLEITTDPQKKTDAEKSLFWMAFSMNNLSIQCQTLHHKQMQLQLLCEHMTEHCQTIHDALSQLKGPIQPSILDHTFRSMTEKLFYALSTYPIEAILPIISINNHQFLRTLIAGLTHPSDAALQLLLHLQRLSSFPQWKEYLSHSLAILMTEDDRHQIVNSLNDTAAFFTDGDKQFCQLLRKKCQNPPATPLAAITYIQSDSRPLIHNAWNQFIGELLHDACQQTVPTQSLYSIRLVHEFISQKEHDIVTFLDETFPLMVNAIPSTMKVAAQACYDPIKQRDWRLLDSLIIGFEQQVTQDRRHLTIDQHQLIDGFFFLCRLLRSTSSTLPVVPTSLIHSYRSIQPYVESSFIFFDQFFVPSIENSSYSLTILESIVEWMASINTSFFEHSHSMILQQLTQLMNLSVDILGQLSDRGEHTFSVEISLFQTLSRVCSLFLSHDFISADMKHELRLAMATFGASCCHQGFMLPTDQFIVDLNQVFASNDHPSSHSSFEAIQSYQTEFNDFLSILDRPFSNLMAQLSDKDHSIIRQFISKHPQQVQNFMRISIWTFLKSMGLICYYYQQLNLLQNPSTDDQTHLAHIKECLSIFSNNQYSLLDATNQDTVIQWAQQLDHPNATYHQVFFHQFSIQQQCCLINLVRAHFDPFCQVIQQSFDEFQSSYQRIHSANAYVHILDSIIHQLIDDCGQSGSYPNFSFFHHFFQLRHHFNQYDHQSFDDLQTICQEFYQTLTQGNPLTNMCHQLEQAINRYCDTPINASSAHVIDLVQNVIQQLQKMVDSQPHPKMSLSLKYTLQSWLYLMIFHRSSLPTSSDPSPYWTMIQSIDPDGSQIIEPVLPEKSLSYVDHLFLFNCIRLMTPETLDWATNTLPLWPKDTSLLTQLCEDLLMANWSMTEIHSTIIHPDHCLAISQQLIQHSPAIGCQFIQAMPVTTQNIGRQQWLSDSGDYRSKTIGLFLDNTSLSSTKSLLSFEFNNRWETYFRLASVYRRPMSELSSSSIKQLKQFLSHLIYENPDQLHYIIPFLYHINPTVFWHVIAKSPSFIDPLVDIIINNSFSKKPLSDPIILSLIKNSVLQTALDQVITQRRDIHPHLPTPLLFQKVKDRSISAQSINNVQQLFNIIELGARTHSLHELKPFIQDNVSCFTDLIYSLFFDSTSPISRAQLFNIFCLFHLLDDSVVLDTLKAIIQEKNVSLSQLAEKILSHKDFLDAQSLHFHVLSQFVTHLFSLFDEDGAVAALDQIEQTNSKSIRFLLGQFIIQSSSSIGFIDLMSLIQKSQLVPATLTSTHAHVLGASLTDTSNHSIWVDCFARHSDLFSQLIQHPAIIIGIRQSILNQQLTPNQELFSSFTRCINQWTIFELIDFICHYHEKPGAFTSLVELYLKRHPLPTPGQEQPMRMNKQRFLQDFVVLFSINRPSLSFDPFLQQLYDRLLQPPHHSTITHLLAWYDSSRLSPSQDLFSQKTIDELITFFDLSQYRSMFIRFMTDHHSNWSDPSCKLLFHSKDHQPSIIDHLFFHAQKPADYVDIIQLLDTVSQSILEITTPPSSLEEWTQLSIMIQSILRHPIQSKDKIIEFYGQLSCQLTRSSWAEDAISMSLLLPFETSTLNQWASYLFDMDDTYLISHGLTHCLQHSPEHFQAIWTYQLDGRIDELTQILVSMSGPFKNAFIDYLQRLIASKQWRQLLNLIDTHDQSYLMAFEPLLSDSIQSHQKLWKLPQGLHEFQFNNLSDNPMKSLLLMAIDQRHDGFMTLFSMFIQARLHDQCIPIDWLHNTIIDLGRIQIQTVAQDIIPPEDSESTTNALFKWLMEHQYLDSQGLITAKWVQGTRFDLSSVPFIEDSVMYHELIQQKLHIIRQQKVNHRDWVLTHLLTHCPDFIFGRIPQQNIVRSNQQLKSSQCFFDTISQCKPLSAGHHALIDNVIGCLNKSDQHLTFLSQGLQCISMKDIVDVLKDSYRPYVVREWIIHALFTAQRHQPNLSDSENWRMSLAQQLFEHLLSELQDPDHKSRIYYGIRDTILCFFCIQPHLFQTFSTMHHRVLSMLFLPSIHQLSLANDSIKTIKDPLNFSTIDHLMKQAPFMSIVNLFTSIRCHNFRHKGFYDSFIQSLFSNPSYLREPHLKHTDSYKTHLAFYLLHFLQPGSSSGKLPNTVFQEMSQGDAIKRLCIEQNIITADGFIKVDPWRCHQIIHHPKWDASCSQPIPTEERYNIEQALLPHFFIQPIAIADYDLICRRLFTDGLLDQGYTHVISQLKKCNQAITQFDIDQILHPKMAKIIHHLFTSTRGQLTPDSQEMTQLNAFVRQLPIQINLASFKKHSLSDHDASVAINYLKRYGIIDQQNTLTPYYYTESLTHFAQSTNQQKDIFNIIHQTVMYRQKMIKTCLIAQHHYYILQTTDHSQWDDSFIALFNDPTPVQAWVNQRLWSNKRYQKHYTRLIRTKFDHVSNDSMSLDSLSDLATNLQKNHTDHSSRMQHIFTESKNQLSSPSHTAKVESLLNNISENLNPIDDK